jgi:putative transposase
MPRGPRLDAPGSLHHVIVRGIERRKIFENDKDRKDFLRRLGQVVIEEQATCFAWSLLPNHAHILLRTGSIPLAKMMRRVLTGYAVSFNLRHQRSGHLFQNRYKSILCEEDAYLLELVRYIHLNCIRARLVTDVECLDRYPWSGHSVLMGNEHRAWQARGEVLTYFSEKEKIARRRYRQFIVDGISSGRREELTGSGIRGRGEKREEESERQSEPRILGSSPFVERILKEEERHVRERALLRRKGIDVEGLMNLIGKKMGVTREEIMGQGQRREVSIARSVFCYLASKNLGKTGRELSRALRLTPAAIHYAIMRGERFLDENGEVKEELINI